MAANLRAPYDATGNLRAHMHVSDVLRPEWTCKPILQTSSANELTLVKPKSIPLCLLDDYIILITSASLNVTVACVIPGTEQFRLAVGQNVLTVHTRLSDAIAKRVSGIVNPFAVRLLDPDSHVGS